MAKKKTKKTAKTGKADAWKSQPADAIRLAALRWFALQIEALAIEIYASDQTRYVAMEEVLRGTLRKLKFERKFVNVAFEASCPDGYVLCKDGLCAPMCDGVIADS